MRAERLRSRRTTCQRCGLEVYGSHATADDCLVHLAPRYERAQRALKAMHKRYKALEDRMARAKIQARVARQAARKGQTLTSRLAEIESRLGIRMVA